MRAKIIPIALATLAGCLAACDQLPHKKQTFENKPLRVEVQTMENRTRVFTHTYIGRIEEESNVPLSALTAGQVTAVYVKTGDRVQAGQALLCIDDTQARNALQAANATLNEAQDAYNRARKVYREGGVTEQKMVSIQSQLEQARSVVSLSRKSLNDCVLRAPADGVVGECKVKVGQTVAPAVPVITLLNMDGYHVAFDVAEADIATLQVGDSGFIQVTAIGTDTLPVRIVEKNLIANTIAHTYTVKALLLGTPRTDLLPGMVSKVWLQSQRISGYFIPSACVQTLRSGKSVWVVQNGIALRRQVEIGQYTADGVIVTRGLYEGDEVIVEGFQKMYNGAKVVK